MEKICWQRPGLLVGAGTVVTPDSLRAAKIAGAILDAAARLVSYNNPYRLEAMAGIDKRLRSPRAGGPPVRHHHFDTVSAEADGVAGYLVASDTTQEPASGNPGRKRS
mgnify:CR=1 FL=1